MLSIGKLKAGQERYYEQQVAQGRDDYYSGKGETAGEWRGSGARALGLGGELDGDDFRGLIEGRDPTTGEQLRRLTKADKVAAYDLTFSAPKSMSVVYAIADERTSELVREAHDEAVDAALSYLEDEACKVRRGKGGAKRQQGAGFVSAAYRHRMSRAEDPQLHTHVVTANLTRGTDGRWSALDGGELYHHAKAAGYLYQAHLRAAVKARLPWVRWTSVEKGVAEIEGVGEGVRREFSTRRQQIEEWLAEEGRAGRRSAEKGALATRAAKEHNIDTPSWRERVRARAAEHGLGPEELGSLAGAPAKRAAAVDTGELAERLSSAAGLTEKHNTFRSRDAVIEWAAAHRDGARVEEVRAEASRYLDRGDVVPIDAAGERLYTTEELLENERAIVATAAERRGAGTAALPRDRVEAFLDRNCPSLREGQREAVVQVATSGNGLDSIEALAGTGKTYVAGALRALYEHEGYRVLGAGPTGRAVRELAEQAGVANAATLARHRLELERYARPYSHRAVLLIDEAGMAHTRESARVIAAAAASDAKVICLGDSGQLASVQAGGWLGSLRERQGAAELREVMRQRDPAERRLLAGVHRGAPRPYVDHKAGAGELRAYASGGEAEAALVEAWERAQAGVPYGEAVMIARENATRERLNAAARERLRASGRLGEAIEIGEREFAVGDRVIARRNDRFHDVDNGTRGTVRALDEEAGEVVVETDASGVRRLPFAYVDEHLEHAYALTGHGMQGGTVEWAGVIGEPEHFTKNWSYTALSRGREPTEIVVVAEPSRFAERAEIGLAPPAEEPLARLGRRMRARDDEDLALDWIEPPELPDAPPPPAEVDVGELREDLARLEARLASFPEEEARELDRVREQRLAAEEVVAKAERNLSRLESQRRTAPADIAFERQRIAQARAIAERTRSEEARLAPRVPDRAAWEAETAVDRERAVALREQLGDARRGHVDAALNRPGVHLVDALGQRPGEPGRRATWVRAARAIEGYRFDYGVWGPDAPGEAPGEEAARRAHREAARAVDDARRKLGLRRATARGIER